ncbi:hypothetical protein LshimejAT787_0900970 [Lyophyllum shimeji]|uniref:Uncharacterized protein n=1 Tax=Lyophyllum shimeji TaxID=47721 RepID=A0A9P3PQM5_LYOSH|nr:hypothetical protein LshimejAT787_0900970 [Lyophyllum shimeji]
MLLVSSFFGRTRPVGDDDSDLESGDEADSDFDESNADFTPADDDVHAVRDDLLHFLPLELVDIILDTAGYWPCLSARSTRHTIVAADDLTSNNAADYYLVTPAIPEEQCTHVKMVKFTLESCDQGWGGDPNNYDTYNASYTWFEAGIVRDSGEGVDVYLAGLPERSIDTFNDHAFNRTIGREVENSLQQERRWHLQYNIQVSRIRRRHAIIWTRDDIIDDAAETDARRRGAGTGRNFVSTLSPGDRVALVVRAQYPGWQNHVFGAKIKIYYSV